MDALPLAVDLLDGLPANRTLGVTVDVSCDGQGVARQEVTGGVTNVIGSLHSSGIVALADAAGLAAVLSAAPDETTARRLQPLGVAARVEFARPVRGIAIGTCELDDAARAGLAALLDGSQSRALITTTCVIGTDEHGRAAEVSFDWTVRLAP